MINSQLNDSQYVPPDISSVQATPVSPPPAPSRSPARTGWAVVLIFICLGLGFLASAVKFQRAVIADQRQQVQVLATAGSRDLGQMEDLGRMLSDPQTRFIPLAGSDSKGPAHALIAWNASQQTGYLFCDQLSILDEGDDYEVWTLHGASDPVKIAAVQASADTSVYPFRIDAGDNRAAGMNVGNRIEITAGPRSVSNPALLSGEVD